MTKRIILMGLLTTILNLFVCSGQTKEDDGKLSKEIEEQLTQSVEAFKNRPIYIELTEQIIDTTPDKNLLQVVFDNLIEKLKASHEDDYKTLVSWNKSRQAIYLIWVLEAEVNNGGYNQFYFNSGGQFYKDLPEALRLVGANKFADLTEKANKTFEQENEKITKHYDGTLEGFSKSYNDNPLNKYDDEFYNLNRIENLQQIQVNYIRQNKIEFIDK